MGKATGTVVVCFGNAGAAYVTGGFPSEAALKARIKNEFGDPWNAMIAAAGFARPAGIPAIDWSALPSFDPSAMTIGSGNHVTLGKEVFRFDDDAQTGHPTFVVITYRLHRQISTTASVYAIYPIITLCTALDGSGNPSGVMRALSIGQFNDTGQYTNASWGTSNGGRPDQQHTFLAARQPGFLFLKMAEHTNSTYYNFNGILALERFRDSQGATDPTDRGVFLLARSVATNNSSMCLLSLDSSLDVSESGSAATPFATPSRTSLVSSGNATKVPVFPMMVGTPQIRSSRNMLCGLREDWAPNTEAALPVPGGGAGTFRSTGKNGENVGTGGSGVRLLVRWEA